MKAYLANLNPVERRFVIGVALLLFIVVNLFWVWPHFSDWSDLKMRLEKAQRELRRNELSIQQTNVLVAQIQKLSSEDSAVPPEDQSMQFFQTIQNQVNMSGIVFEGNSRPTMRTNEFFIEQEQPISVRGDEKKVVDFLYKLGAGNSLIRVKSLSLRPADASRQQLRADMTLVASYQKKLQPRSATATAKPAAAKPGPNPAAPGAKPAAQKPPTQPKKK